jgi:hypothetical protein
LYSSSNIRIVKPRRIRWVVHVGCTGEMRAAYKILVGGTEGKRSFEKSRHRWEE